MIVGGDDRDVVVVSKQLLSRQTRWRLKMRPVSDEDGPRRDIPGKRTLSGIYCRLKGSTNDIYQFTTHATTYSPPVHHQDATKGTTTNPRDRGRPTRATTGLRLAGLQRAHKPRE